MNRAQHKQTRANRVRAASTALEKVDLVIRNRTDELPRVIGALDELMRRHRLPDTALDMHVALDEVLSNIVKYAYADAASHDIHVRLKVSAHRLEVEIEDDGKAFDPLQAQQQDRSVPLAQREPGRLGVSIVKRLMSEVAYQRVNGRNRITLVRRLDR